MESRVVLSSVPDSWCSWSPAEFGDTVPLVSWWEPVLLPLRTNERLQQVHLDTEMQMKTTESQNIKTSATCSPVIFLLPCDVLLGNLGSFHYPHFNQQYQAPHFCGPSYCLGWSSVLWRRLDPPVSSCPTCQSHGWDRHIIHPKMIQWEAGPAGPLRRSPVHVGAGSGTRQLQTGDGK